MANYLEEICSFRVTLDISSHVFYIFGLCQKDIGLAFLVEQTYEFIRFKQLFFVTSFLSYQLFFIFLYS